MSAGLLGGERWWAALAGKMTHVARPRTRDQGRQAYRKVSRHRRCLILKERRQVAQVAKGAAWRLPLGPEWLKRGPAGGLESLKQPV